MTGDRHINSSETPNGSRGVVGALVRVVTRRGAVVEGVCLDAWRLRMGGTALKIKPLDGSGPREVTTLEPVRLIDQPQSESA